ncbi:transposase [uncultured Muribaculum sp.]|uniref:transposase n=1 Tax=uncultured Muribaculum sp. TaxID=1918613 RepID=UPI0025A67864|nr:transposase [uncultured Muribaculum sp.]
MAEVYRLNASTLGKAYRDKLSDFQTWNQRSHATEWILHEENVGEYMSIDETAPSRGDLFTILSNKDGHGRKGTVASIVSGTNSGELTAVFDRIPLEKRLGVREVTMDFSDSMSAAVTHSFPNARITIDCFHVVQLVSSALSEMRMSHKRQEMKDDARLRREFKNKIKRNNEQRRKRELERKQSGMKKSTRGRKPNRANMQYVSPRLENGDTAVELLTRSRYLILQSRDKWTDSQKKRAEILFDRYPDMLEAYSLVNRLRSIFKNKDNTVESGKSELATWCDDVQLTKFETLKTAAETIESRIDEVANYFEQRHTNASAESLNSKLKGFRSMLRGVSDMPFFMYRVSTIFG